MKHILKYFALATFVGLVHINTCSAWFVEGSVVCDAQQSHSFNASYPGVSGVLVEVANVSGTFVSSNWTTTDGTYLIGLPENPDTYLVYVHPLTLPPGTTAVLPPVETFTLSSSVTNSTNNFVLENPDCVTTNNGCGPMPTTITCVFDETPICAGNTIWFNSACNVSGVDTTNGTTITFTNVTITSGCINISLPTTIVTFSPTCTQVSAVSNCANGTWQVTVPVNCHQNVFFGGAAYCVPKTIPGGSCITWSGNICSSTPGVKVCWEWTANVYNTAKCPKLFSNLSNCRIQPEDGYGKCSDHAGTPEGTACGVVVKTQVCDGGRGHGHGHDHDRDHGKDDYSCSYSSVACVQCDQ